MNFYYDIKFSVLGTIYATLGVVVTSLYQVVSIGYFLTIRYLRTFITYMFKEKILGKRHRSRNTILIQIRISVNCRDCKRIKESMKTQYCHYNDYDHNNRGIKLFSFLATKPSGVLKI